MLNITQRLLSTSFQHSQGNPAGKTPQRERDEILESSDQITYLLEAPHLARDDIHVSVLPSEISVVTPEFGLKRSLPAKVDPATAKVEYNNDVLSVRVRKQK